MSATEATYLRATSSSHLEWRPTIADVDWLVAAGLIRESLATRLIRLRADFDAVSATTESRALMPMLRGYKETGAYLLAHAITSVTGRRNAPGDDQLPTLVFTVLALFLDPNCPMCDGRGFTGSYGSPMIRCSACRESGKRSAYWKDDRQEEFAKWLQSSIEMKITRALDDMRRLLRTG